MSDLQKIHCSQSHRDFVKQSGFDIDDPDRRHPAQPHALYMHLQKSQSLQPNQNQNTPLTIREQAHIAARLGASKILQRGFGVLCFGFVCTTALQDIAIADGHHAAKYYADGNEYHFLPTLGPVSYPSSDLPVTLNPANEARPTVLSWHEMIDPRDSVWIPVLLGGLCLLGLINLIMQACLHKHLFNREVTTMNGKHLETNDKSTILESPNTTPEIPKTAGTKVTCTIGGASRVGKFRAENQDTFRLLEGCDLRNGFVLCDGAGGHAGGREAAQNAATVIKQFLDAELENNQACKPDSSILGAIDAARKSAEAGSVEGITTAIVCVFEGDQLHYATLGDGGLCIIWPDGMVSQHLVPHHFHDQPSNVIGAFIGHNCHIPPRVGSVRLEPGCIVAAMSDGASDIFEYDHFAEQRKAYTDAFKKNPSNLTDDLLYQIEEVRDPDTDAYLHNDNMTLVMAQLTKEEV